MLTLLGQLDEGGMPRSRCRSVPGTDLDLVGANVHGGLVESASHVEPAGLRLATFSIGDLYKRAGPSACGRAAGYGVFWTCAIGSWETSPPTALGTVQRETVRLKEPVPLLGLGRRRDGRPLRTSVRRLDGPHGDADDPGVGDSSLKLREGREKQLFCPDRRVSGILNQYKRTFEVLPTPLVFGPPAAKRRNYTTS